MNNELNNELTRQIFVATTPEIPFGLNNRSGELITKNEYCVVLKSGFVVGNEVLDEPENIYLMNTKARLELERITVPKNTTVVILKNKGLIEFLSQVSVEKLRKFSSLDKNELFLECVNFAGQFVKNNEDENAIFLKRKRGEGDGDVENDRKSEKRRKLQEMEEEEKKLLTQRITAFEN